MSLVDTVPDDGHDPFAGGPIARVVPTTAAQREVLAVAMLGDDANLSYNEAVAIRLAGPITAVRVRQALAQLVARRDALRATFTPQMDAMCIGEVVHFGWREFHHDEADAEARVAAARVALTRMPLPLTTGPLLVAEWHQLASESAELLILVHHVVCDGWSFHVLLGELAALCGERRGDRLPPAASFADFASEAAVRGPSRHVDWWGDRLAQAVPLKLPLDGASPATRTFAARQHATSIRGFAAAVEALQVSATSAALAAVAVLMWRAAGADDVLLGLPVARQSTEDRPDLVGHCVQILPVRLRVDAAMSISALATAAQAAVLDAAEHYDATFGELVARLGMSGTAGRVPLLPVVVNVDPRGGQLRFGPAVGEVRTLPRVAEAFELFLNLTPEGSDLRVEATYQCDLYHPHAVANWIDALAAVVRGAAADPATTIGSIAVSSAACEAVVRGPDATGRSSCWLPWLAESSRRHPGGAAVCDGSGAASYAELAEQVDRLAAGLCALGIAPGNVVAVGMARTRQLVATMTAVMRAGAVYLPLDPGFPESRLVRMLADSGAVAIVLDESTADSLPTNGCRVLTCAELLVAGAAGRVPELPAGTDTAYLLYTSGSTGVPKGVRVSHASLANLLASMAVTPGLAAGEALVAVTTVSFDISILELLLPLTVGGTVAVASRDEAEAPDRLMEVLGRVDAKVCQATPATWRLLLDAGWVGKADLRAWSGGERLSEDLAARLLPRVQQLWNLYGPTETTIWSTVARVTHPGTASRIGSPIHDTVVAVVDERGRVLPAGFPGELWIGGAGVAEGYHADAGRTAQRFVTHPALGRVYRTGDLGRLRLDGQLECRGRVDDQVKVRGFRIELGEVESALRTLPMVRDAAAGVVHGTDGVARLVAVVVSPVLPSAWQEAVRRLLPYYMVPQQLVPVDSLPTLPNGKLDRNRLATLVVATSATSLAAPSPMSVAEQQVAEAMAEVLGTGPVGAEDDFFALGGHSLQAAQFVTRWNRRFGTDFKMRSVFDAPTPRAFAALLLTAPARRAASRIPRRADGRRAPLTLAQERMWHVESLGGGFSGYNLPSAHRLRGRLSVPALREAITRIVARQPALRTTFERVDGELAQLVHESAPFDWPATEDLSAYPVEQREQAVRRRLDELAVVPFRLDRLPLFRVHLFKLAEEEHVFFFMPHHMVWDGWSFDVLYQEIDAHYRSALGETGVHLPALAIEPGDHAAWQRRLEREPTMRAKVEALRSRIGSFGTVSPLPTDLPRQVGMIGSGGALWIDIDDVRSAALHRHAQSRHTTVSVLLLATFSGAVAEFAGADRLLLASPVRGRDSVEEEGVMGCWNRLVALPIAVDRQAGFDTLTTNVQESLLSGLETADVPLEMLGDAVLGTSVLYQALYSFQDVRGRRSRWGDLEHSMIHLFQRGATEDVGVWFVEGRSGIGGMLTYNAGLFRLESIEALRSRFLQLLDEFLSRPAEPLRHVLRAAPVRDRRGVGDRMRTGEAEARDDFEVILVQLWRELLGVADLGVADDVFQFGANSLAAIRCVVRFEAMTGIAIPLGEVFRTPTVRGLAASLRSREVRHGPLVVPLQPRGEGPPVFCLLGIQVYRRMAAALGAVQPVYGVYVPEEQALVEGGRRVSIERLASAYTEVLAKQLGPGPCTLLGLSFGGIIAMQVAIELRRLGKQVDRVVLVDSILSGGVTPRWWYGLARSVYRGLGRRLVTLLRGRKAAGDVATGGADHALEHALDDMHREVAAWQSRFEPPDCQVLLLRATRNSWGRGYRVVDAYGWRTLLGDRLRVADLEGDHLGILLNSDMRNLADVLGRFLVRAR